MNEKTIIWSDNYIINTDGDLFSTKYSRKTKMKPTLSSDGYFYTYIRCSGKSKWVSIHRLVAEFFIENPLNKLEVNHIDSDRENNCVSNLEWCTRSENIKHSHRFGNASNLGSRNPSACYHESDVLIVCELLTHVRPMQIVRQFGYKRSFVMGIYLRKNWRHISDRYVFTKTKAEQDHSKNPHKIKASVREISIKLLNSGVKNTEICKTLNISKSYVYSIKKGLGLC